jgi:hypothetical protein
MAITKETVVEKVEVIGKWNIQVATDTIIKEDGTEISRSRHRHTLEPCSSSYLCKDNSTEPLLDADGKKQWTHTDTDVSNEDSKVQAIANALWTDAIKQEFKTFKENDKV